MIGMFVGKAQTNSFSHIALARISGTLQKTHGLSPCCGAVVIIVRPEYIPNQKRLENYYVVYYFMPQRVFNAAKSSGVNLIFLL